MKFCDCDCDCDCGYINKQNARKTKTSSSIHTYICQHLYTSISSINITHSLQLKRVFGRGFVFIFVQEETRELCFRFGLFKGGVNLRIIIRADVAR